MRQHLAADRSADIFKDFPQAAPVVLPGSRGLNGSAGGSQSRGARPGSLDRAARGCSNSSASSRLLLPNHLRTHPAGNRKEDS